MSDNLLGGLVARLAADLTDLKKGLLDGRNDLAAMRAFTDQTSKAIKDSLKFAGISLGLYELISQAKEFGKSILEEGGKVEVLKASAEALAHYYNMSASSIEVYLQKLREKNIEEPRALEAINGFMKAGVSIDKLPDLADAAKVLGASMGLPMQEAFSSIVQGIVKGTPKQLAEMVPGIREVLQGMSSETKQVLDSTIISGAEKSQILTDVVLAAYAKMKGAGDDLQSSYFSQLAEYKAKVADVKAALFEMVKPIGMAITKEAIKTWDDFYTAIGKNKQALRDIGETAAIYIGKIASGVRTVTEFAARHKDLVLALLEIKGILTLIKWTGIEAGITAISQVLVKLGLLRAALAGPWALMITVGMVGLDHAINSINKELKDKQYTAFGGEGPDMGGSDLPLAEKVARNRRKRDENRGTPGSEGEGSEEAAKGATTDVDEWLAAKAKKQADKAAKDRKNEANALLPAGKGGSGKEEPEEDLWGAYYKMMEQKRQAELQEAQNSVSLLKSTNEEKKAELEKQLQEGLIDGTQYYAKLQDLSQGETTAELKLIDQKKAAQAAAYKDALGELGRQDMSPEMRTYREYEEAQKNRMAMANLDAEANKTKLQSEIQVTNELKRQVELKKQYQDKTAELNLETAQLMGAISSQEATLQKLNLDWQKAKAEAIKAGASPEYLAALDKNLKAKQADAQYGGYSGAITSGLSSMITSMFDGSGKDLGQQMKQGFNNMFKSLFTEALKPGLEQLKQLLTQGFKDLFKDAGAGVASAVMGAIALVGMLLTSGGSKSSFTSSGVTSAVTAHEAMRGIIAGDTSIPIAQIGTSLQDALVPAEGLLSQIEINTRNMKVGGSGGGTTVQLSLISYDIFKEWVNKYLSDQLMQGAPA
ncbi:MAG: hypothetical protein ACHQ2F_01080 [Desulfobaccales bacterium]